MAIIARKSAGASQNITDLSSAVGFTSPPATTAITYIQVYGQTVWARDDGTDPTVGQTIKLEPGFTYQYTGPLSAIKFIEAASGASLNAAFYTEFIREG